MKAAAIIPTRGNRPQFLEHCLFMLSKQTRPFDKIMIIDDPPASGEKDITWRYRKGLMEVGEIAEACFLIEDDDYYSPSYVENMLEQWELAGRPELLGIGKTCYYHLVTKKKSEQTHPGRACANSTLIRSDAVKKIKWPADNEPLFDKFLWAQADSNGTIKGVDILPEGWLCIGIKHGMGLYGGCWPHDGAHHGYDYNDVNMEWLKKNVDGVSFDFYSKTAQTLIAQ